MTFARQEERLNNTSVKTRQTATAREIRPTLSKVIFDWWRSTTCQQPLDRPRSHWRDHVSHLVWECHRRRDWEVLLKKRTPGIQWITLYHPDLTLDKGKKMDGCSKLFKYLVLKTDQKVRKHSAAKLKPLISSTLLFLTPVQNMVTELHLLWNSCYIRTC